MKKTKGNYKLILDHHRGVYFGDVKEAVDQPDGTCKVRVEGMRHGYGWSVDKPGEKGVYGLATVGPKSDDRVGPAVNCWIYHVVKLVDMSVEAISAWKEAKWE